MLGSQAPVAVMTAEQSTLARKNSFMRTCAAQAQSRIQQEHLEGSGVWGLGLAASNFPSKVARQELGRGLVSQRGEAGATRHLKIAVCFVCERFVRVCAVVKHVWHHVRDGER